MAPYASPEASPATRNTFKCPGVCRGRDVTTFRPRIGNK
jgi:hypothetical protein